MRTKRVAAPKKEVIVISSDSSDSSSLVAPKKEVIVISSDFSDSSSKRSRAIPHEVQAGGSPVYKVMKPLGRGGYGQVFLGRRVSGGDERTEGPGAMEVAMKFEHEGSGCSEDGAPKEWRVYENLGDVHGVPKVHFKGKQGAYNIMVMDILGPSLQYIWRSSGKSMSAEMVARIAVEALSILAEIHSRGYVHGDVKPENILLSNQSSPQKKLFIVDFGLAIEWKDCANRHVVYAQIPDRFRGTVKYASVHALLGRTPSRRDDLESLAYTLIYLVQGWLPWEKLRIDENKYHVAKKKMSTSPGMFSSCPAPFREFMHSVINLKFDEEPDYSKFISFFEGLIGADPSAWPFQIDGTLKIILAGQKRPKRDRDAGDNQQARKKVCNGIPASQRLNVFSFRQPIKQRYHHNITDDNLHQLVKEGNQQGLRISSVASCSCLWTLVLDDGTNYTDQVFHISNSLLPMEWIMEQTNNEYYITSLAGASDGRSLVVMSKGGPSFYDQTWIVRGSFPFKWIKKKWKKGFHVTSMATVDNYWVVVMSSGCDSIDQVVELDFLYPSEGIHNHWNKGYLITSAAATQDQVAVILSHPKWKPGFVLPDAVHSTNLRGKSIQEKCSSDLLFK